MKYACMFGGLLLASIGMAAAVPLSINIRPTPGTDGQVAELEVTQVIDTRTIDGSSLSLRAAISAIRVEHIADSIVGLTMSDAGGVIGLATADDAPTAGADFAFRHWRAERATSPPVVVRYRIPVQPPAERGGPPFGMRATGGGVAGNGIGFLLLPENIASDETRVTWDLSGLEKGAVAAFSAGDGDFTLPGPATALQDHWVLAGPALTVGDPAAKGFHGYLIGSPPFDGKTMLDWAARSYEVLAHRFGYLGRPDYRLMLRALPGKSFGSGTAGGHVGGALVTLGSSYVDGQDNDYIRTVSFHEMTHHWVGKIGGENSWFNEGLTVFLTATWPCEAGLMSPAACAAELNYLLRDYYRSAGRDWSQARIASSGFSVENVRAVPYARGALYFSDINARIVARSHGKRTLVDALRPLLLQRETGRPFETASFESMLRRELGQSAVTAFREAVLEGSTPIIPPSNAFGPCLERVIEQIKPEHGGSAVNGYVWRPIAVGAQATCHHGSSPG